MCGSTSAPESRVACPIACCSHRRSIVIASRARPGRSTGAGRGDGSGRRGSGIRASSSVPVSSVPVSSVPVSSVPVSSVPVSGCSWPVSSARPPGRRASCTRSLSPSRRRRSRLRGSSGPHGTASPSITSTNASASLGSCSRPVKASVPSRRRTTCNSSQASSPSGGTSPSGSKCSINAFAYRRSIRGGSTRACSASVRSAPNQSATDNPSTRSRRVIVSRITARCPEWISPDSATVAVTGNRGANGSPRSDTRAVRSAASPTSRFASG